MMFKSGLRYSFHTTEFNIFNPNDICIYEFSHKNATGVKNYRKIYKTSYSKNAPYL